MREAIALRATASGCLRGCELAVDTECSPGLTRCRRAGSSLNAAVRVSVGRQMRQQDQKVAVAIFDCRSGDRRFIVQWFTRSSIPSRDRRCPICSPAGTASTPRSARALAPRSARCRGQPPSGRPLTASDTRSIRPIVGPARRGVDRMLHCPGTRMLARADSHWASAAETRAGLPQSKLPGFMAPGL
jgi:hypothetical protein